MRARVALVAVALGATLWLPLPAGAQTLVPTTGTPTAPVAPAAARLGRITGRVTNGTAGATSAAGALVRVIPVRGQRAEQPVTATLDAAGTFTVTGLVASADVTYWVGATYGGAASVHPEAITLRPEQPALEQLTLTVFEPSTDVPLTVRTGSVLLSPQPERGVIDVAEVWVVANGSDRTRVAGPDGTVVRWPVPAGARELRWGDASAGAAEVDGAAVLDRRPVPPGERELTLRYVVPYDGPTVALSRTMALPAAEVRLLVLSDADAVTLASDQLTAPQELDLAGRRVVGVSGRNVAAGTVLTARLDGLPPPRRPPAPGMLPRPPAAWPERLPALLALGVTILGILVAVGYPALAERRGLLPRRLAEERARLVEELALLDRQHEAGRVADAAYRQRRATLMSQAVAVSRAQAATDTAAKAKVDPE